MVVQKSSIVDQADQNSTTEGPSADTWSFQIPAVPFVTIRSNVSQNMNAKQPITRQIAINTLAAMHRRFSLPGPVQPHSRPIAEFRASANKSLDMLRQTVQSAVTREIDQVIKKYLEKFFVPAVNNIRLNLGDESVSEDQVRAICRAMLDATRLLYTTPPKPSTASPFESADAETGTLSDSRIPRSALQSALQPKRKDFEDSDATKRKKVKQEEIDSGVASPIPSAAIRDPVKWNPARLTQDTLFIMGSHAHKVLGLGNARGRLYTRHAGLLRYPADSADKEWIANHNLVNAVGGKTYIMVLEDIEELATSEAYRHSSLPMLGELTGFKVPPFMLRKIKTYMLKRALSDLNIDNPLPSTSNIQDVDKYKLDDIKLETHQDYDIANEYDTSKDFSDMPNITKDGQMTDLADIRVEDINAMKDDGITEIKVEDIKVEDLDVSDIKVENIDDIDVDGIKVEDIKLESDDAFDLCKQSEDEQSQLVDGLLDADIEFLSRNLGNIESDADARKTIEKLTGTNADTITLVGDEFDLSSTLNTNFQSSQQTKCITVASTTSGMIHSVPVAHLASPRMSGSTVHYYTSTSVPSPRTIHHLSIPQSTHQLIQRIPINPKTGTFSTVMSQGTANTIIGFGTRSNNATIIGTPQYVNVTSKSFPTGNILHNAIVSRNIINRAVTSGVTFNVTTVRPALHNTTPKISTVTTASAGYDSIATTKDVIDMIENCNSSVMLKKVLTLGTSGATKSYMMHNTQKVLSTGFANGVTPPPNVTIVSSGTSGGGNIHNNTVTPNIMSPNSGNLSATHATLSALLASSNENAQASKN